MLIYVQRLEHNDSKDRISKRPPARSVNLEPSTGLAEPGGPERHWLPDNILHRLGGTAI